VQKKVRTKQIPREAAKPRSWIPVEREMPDDETTVIIATAEDVGEGFHCNGRWYFTAANRPVSASNAPSRFRVSHWQHLPEPPASTLRDFAPSREAAATACPPPSH
jgi:hypothetical protein